MTAATAAASNERPRPKTTGSLSAIARRVIGRVRLKTATPMRPSSRPLPSEGELSASAARAATARSVMPRRRRGVTQAVLDDLAHDRGDRRVRSEEHTSELTSLMRISYAGFCLQNKHKTKQ